MGKFRTEIKSERKKKKVLQNLKKAHKARKLIFEMARRRKESPQLVEEALRKAWKELNQ